MLKQTLSQTLPHWSYRPKLKGLTGIYLNASLRTFALGLSGIFIPIFILDKTGQISAVFMFYFLAVISQLVIIWPLARIISIIGPDLSMTISLIAQIIFFFFLFLVNRNIAWIWAAAFFLAIIVPLYWIPYHLAFTRIGSHQKLGQQIGAVNILTRLAAGLAPLIGGVIISLSNFNYLWWLVIGLSLLAILPIFWDEYDHREKTVNLKEVWQFFKMPSHRPAAMAYIGTGIEASLYGVAWPLFTYYQLGKLVSLGLISSFALVASILLAWQIGRWANRQPNRILKAGSRLNAVNWLLKALASNPYLLGLIDTAYQLGGLLVWVPFGIITYRQARQKPFVFLIGREFLIHIGWIIGLALSGALYFISQNWWLIFSAGFLALLLIGKLGQYETSTRGRKIP